MHPILVDFGVARLHSYGFLVALGGLLSALFWVGRRGAMGLRSEDQGWALVNAILAGGFLGGRVLHLLQYERPFSPGFWGAAFSVSAGFSVMGSFVGVGAGVWAFCRWAGASWLRVMDYVCLAAPAWHVFGRLGCLAAGCCYGLPTDKPWAVVFTDPRGLTPAELLGVPLHPAQLYEAAGDLALAAALYRFILPRVESGRLRRGSLCAAEFCGYALLRFAAEAFRGDTLAGPFGLTAAQGLCVLLFFVGAWLWSSLNRGRRA